MGRVTMAGGAMPRRKEVFMDKELLSDVIGALSQTVDLLYQENQQLAYRQLAVTLPRLEQVIGQMDNDAGQLEFVDKLQEALSAMEEGDSTLLADIISYELIEKLEMLSEE